jgi:hypothetical protein
VLYHVLISSVWPDFVWARYSCSESKEVRQMHLIPGHDQDSFVAAIV